ncbi:MAG: efflux RND transporter periplasmic adaptor subunit [Coxiellaceae bacterium]|nr:efflux RND transporter periplasmic adaptor subunit [Coxiellaceae bacterium]
MKLFRELFCLFLVLSIGVLGYQQMAFAEKKPSKNKTITTASLVNKPVVVQVAKAKVETLPIYVDALGSLSAVNRVTVSSETAGRVAQIFFKDGQMVGKDMPILKLDDSSARANYNVSVTTLNVNRKKYKRGKAILPIGGMSTQQVEELKAALENNDSRVKRDLAILSQQTMTAPFSGTLGAFNVQVGDYVSAGDPIVTLVSRKTLLVDFNVSQAKLPHLQMSQLVRITVDAYPKKVFYGTVNFISPTVSKTTRAVQVQALVQNKSNELSPGMFCHVQQQIGVNKNALVVPEVAVNADIKGYYVYKLVGKKAVKAYVTPGTSQKGMVQISQGLNAGDTVVTAGQQKLQDGSTVIISSNNSGS